MPKKRMNESVALHRERVLENLNALDERLKGIREVYDTANESTKEHLDRIEHLLEKMNGRVRKNESDVSWIKGLGTGVGLIFSALITYLLGWRD